MNSSFHQGAEFDFVEAIQYYQRQQIGLGRAFAKAVDATVYNLVHVSHAAPKLYRDCRFRKVKRYPYLVIFRVEDNFIHIFAIAHEKRDLSYWRDRLAD